MFSLSNRPKRRCPEKATMPSSSMEPDAPGEDVEDPRQKPLANSGAQKCPLNAAVSPFC